MAILLNLVKSILLRAQEGVVRNNGKERQRNRTGGMKVGSVEVHIIFTDASAYYRRPLSSCCRRDLGSVACIMVWLRGSG